MNNNNNNLNNKVVQCFLCKNYISHINNLRRHTRTKKCIRFEISNHLDKFWELQKDLSK